MPAANSAAAGFVRTSVAPAGSSTVTDRRALDAYLAYMMLRQVDWSLRHHATVHHLRLARLIVMTGPASDIAAQHPGRARCVPERTVKHGNPQPPTGRPEHHQPAKAQLSGTAQ
jgi:hypothetical protein